MTLKTRAGLAFLLGTTALAAMVWGCVARAARGDATTAAASTPSVHDHGTSTADGHADNEYGWVRMDTSSFKDEIPSLAFAVSKRLVSDGMSEAKATKLADDLLVIIPSVFESDFDAYDRLMTSKGAKLDKIADGFVSAMLEWKLYADDIPALSASEPTRKRVRYIWNHPESRDVKWKAFRPASLMVGYGLLAESNTPEWPYTGHYSQLSLYAPESGRLMEAAGKRLNKSKDAVWIMLEGRFQSNMQTRMKINFYFDEKAAAWFPVTVVFGTDKDHRPFPMQ